MLLEFISSVVLPVLLIKLNAEAQQKVVVIVCSSICVACPTEHRTLCTKVLTPYPLFVLMIPFSDQTPHNLLSYNSRKYIYGNHLVVLLTDF